MKWYQKTPIIILFLIFVFPVGIYLMWKYTSWKPTVKAVISILLLIAFVGAFFTPNSQPAVASAESSSDAASSSAAPVVSYSSSEPSSEPSSSVQDPEILKSVAIVIDTQIYENILASEKIEKLLEEGIQETDNGTATLLDLYNLAKTAKETQFTVWSNLQQLSDDNTSDYVSACQGYVLNNQTIAEQLMKYIDKNEMKYLSEVTSAIEGSNLYILSLLEARIKYLSSQGVSDDEISEILAAAEESAAQ